MNEDQKKYLNALNISLSPNPEAAIKILSSSLSPSPKEAMESNEEDLKKLGFRQKTILNFLEKRNEINIEKEWDKLEKEKIKVISKDEKEYPEILKEIAKPPACLYIKGELLPDEKYFASVGTRWPSDYGKMVVGELIGDVSQNFTVVSGMARGIDSLSHKEIIKRGKRTIAVIGTGLDIVFPPENKNLEKEIEIHGAIISEFPLGVPPLQYNFPLRNRIIAGMSVGVLITEGKTRSGALITANSALEEGREVFAVPGPIFSKTSEGPNNLIKQGAHPVTCAGDILAVFNLEKAMKEEKEIKGDTKEENIIIAFLKERPASIEEIIKETKLEAGKINSTLILMEIQNKIKRSGNQYMIGD